MKKIIYTITIILTLFIGVNMVDAEELLSCTYNYEFDGKGTSLKFTINETKTFFGNHKTELIKSCPENGKCFADSNYSSMYIFKDKDFINSVYANNSVSSCPILNFATFTSSNKPENSYVNISLTSSTTEPCAGIDEVGYTCTPKTGVSGVLEILSDTVNKVETEIVYCENSYVDSNLGPVIAKAFNDGKNNYFQLSSTNGEKLGTALPGGQFKVGDYWYSVPNKSSIFSKNCNPSDLVLKANKDKVQNLDKKDKDDQTSVDTSDGLISCENAPKTVKLIKQVYTLIRYLVPVLIIALSIVDFLKVLLSGEEKAYKTAWSKFIKRLIIGVVILILPILISFIINLSGALKGYGIDSDSLFCIFI